MPSAGAGEWRRRVVDLHLVTVAVTCFNEERTVRTLLERAAAQSLESLSAKTEIVVVDDGSTDGTRALVEGFRAEHPELEMRVISYSPNRGKGYAVRKALEAARGEFFLTQDADLEYNPADWPAVLAPLVSGMTPVVYGSRWLAPVMRRSGTLYTLGGWAENRFLHLFYRTNISDIATGFKAFRTELLRSLNLECVGFEFCPEVTAKLLNRNVPIIEVPIGYNPRTKAEGKKIHWTDFFHALYTILRVRFRRF